MTRMGAFCKHCRTKLKDRTMKDGRNSDSPHFYITCPNCKRQINSEDGSIIFKELKKKR